MQAPPAIPGTLGSGSAAKQSQPNQGRCPLVARSVGPVHLLAILSWPLLDQPPTRAADPGSSPDRRPVVFGPAKDLAELPVVKRCFSDGPMPAEVRTQTLTFQQEESGCFVYPAPEGFDYLAVGELQPGTEPGQPQLPMKTFVLTLDRQAEVYGVEVVNGTYREVQPPLAIVPIPWAGLQNDGKYVADEGIYRSNQLFPGYLLGFDHGLDNARQHVFVRFFPLQ